MSSTIQILYTIFFTIASITVITCFLYAYDIIDCCKTTDKNNKFDNNTHHTYKLTVNPCQEQHNNHDLQQYFTKYKPQPPHIAINITKST